MDVQKRVAIPTADERAELAESLINQCVIRHQTSMHCNRMNAKAGMKTFPTTIEGVILRNGVARWGARLPANFKKLANRLCFSHAAKLAGRDSRYIYCEGIAAKTDLGMAIHHAWVVDAEDGFRVIDNTWRNPVLGAYIGIPFDTEFMWRTVCRKKTYGVIEDWQHNYPVLTMEPWKYLHALAGDIPRDFAIPEFSDDSVWDKLKEQAA